MLKIAFLVNIMRYLELKEALKEFTVFSVNDIKKIEATFHRRRLNNWQDKGYIKKVIKGYYMFTDLPVDENILYEIANKIYSPSYVSLEKALSHYHLIPESVYEVTSVTARTPRILKTTTTSFSYRSIKPDFYFGYKIVNYDRKSYLIAEIEKAILDYIYLNAHLKTFDDFAGMRINVDSFKEQVDEQKLIKYLEAFGQKQLANRTKKFLEVINNA